MIIVMVLQNRMDILKSELGSCCETCGLSTHDGNDLIGINVERVTGMTGRGPRASDNSSYKDRTRGKLYVCGEYYAHFL